MPMVWSGNRNHVDVLAFEHPPQIRITLNVDAAVLQLLLLFFQHPKVGFAQSNHARAFHLREAADVILATASATDHTNANVISGTKHLRPRARGNAKSGGACEGGGEKTTAIDLFHTINVFLTVGGFGLLTLFRVLRVTLGDFSLFFVAFVDVEAVFESHALPRIDFQVTRALGFLLEIVNAKGICRKQSVVAHVPPRGMTRVAGMVEDRDAQRFPFYWPRVIAPRRLLAPRIFAGHAGAEHDVSGGFALVELVRRQPHCFGEPNCHRSLFRITEHYVLIASLDRDFEIKKPLVARPRVDAERSFIGASDCAI